MKHLRKPRRYSRVARKFIMYIFQLETFSHSTLSKPPKKFHCFEKIPSQHNILNRSSSKKNGNTTPTNIQVNDIKKKVIYAYSAWLCQTLFSQHPTTWSECGTLKKIERICHRIQYHYASPPLPHNLKFCCVI